MLAFASFSADEILVRQDNGTVSFGSYDCVKDIATVSFLTHIVNTRFTKCPAWYFDNDLHHSNRPLYKGRGRRFARPKSLTNA